MTELLSAHQLTKRHASGPASTLALNHVDLTVQSHDFVSIMGASGAGKSTLLYMLSGMDAPTSGTLRYREQLLDARDDRQMTRLRQHDFGFIFQNPNLVSNLSLSENISVAGYASGQQSSKEVEERTAQLLEFMGLTAVADHRPTAVSGGEAQRAAIARAVINKPTLLFADEPTGALNRKNGDAVLELLSHFHDAGQTVIMVTHDAHAACRANRVIYLQDGAILDELQFSPAVMTADQWTARERQLVSWLSTLSW